MVGTAGQSLVVGIGAGANLPASDLETTAIGYHCLNLLTTVIGEATCAGWQSGSNLLFAAGPTLYGDGALIFEVAAIDDNCSGADTCRNIMGSGEVTAMGRRTMAYGTPFETVGYGTQAVEGNSGSVAVTGIATTSDTLNVTYWQPTNAITASASGTTTLTVTGVGSATFTGNGSGTTLTASAVTGSIVQGAALTGTGVPANTWVIVGDKRAAALLAGPEPTYNQLATPPHPPAHR